jgi:xanthine dehydrogenase YagR molybdenum-binding subunit
VGRQRLRGTASWAWAINEAAAQLRGQPRDPTQPATVTVNTAQVYSGQLVRELHAYSAIFAEVTVDPATGEVRTRRLLGMFAVGRVVDPLLARSQVIGGMIVGLGMALHEEGVRDPVSGRHVNADFAGYHVPAHADVPDVEADFVPDYEPDDPSGVKVPARSAPSAPRPRSPTPCGTPQDAASGHCRSVLTG